MWSQLYVVIMCTMFVLYIIKLKATMTFTFNGLISKSKMPMPNLKNLGQFCGLLRGSVVKCLTRNPEVLGQAAQDPLGFFVGVSLGKTLQSSSLVLVKPRKDTNNVSRHRDMTEILLKAV